MSHGLQYSKGCRCERCVAKHRLAAKLYSRAERRAAIWVRQKYPGVFGEILDDVYQEAGIARQPVGRPKRSAA